MAVRIAAHVNDGELIGVGSGSATYMALWAIGQRVQRESLADPHRHDLLRDADGRVHARHPHPAAGVGAAGVGSGRRRRVGPARPPAQGPRRRDVHGEGPLGHVPEDVSGDRSEQAGRAAGTGLPDPDRGPPPCGRRWSGGRSTLMAARAGALRIAGGKDGPVVTEWGNLVIDAWFDDIPQGLHARAEGAARSDRDGTVRGLQVRGGLTDATRTGGRGSPGSGRCGAAPRLQAGRSASLSRVIGPRSRAQLLAVIAELRCHPDERQPLGVGHHRLVLTFAARSVRTSTIARWSRSWATRSTASRPSAPSSATSPSSSISRAQPAGVPLRAEGAQTKRNRVSCTAQSYRLAERGVPRPADNPERITKSNRFGLLPCPLGPPGEVLQPSCTSILTSFSAAPSSGCWSA